MARGPDGKGGGAGFSLADQLFNAGSVGDLASELATGIPGFDAARFSSEVMSGLADRTLLARLDWIADCAEAQLPQDFNAMADCLEASLPPPLDPDLTDDDFGRFIHGIYGVLAVRHGLEAHHDRALDLLHAATRCFSMEFYIRPFLNRWPDDTLARLDLWAKDDNYHVRRLVSEGTRPKLPWARAITLDPLEPLRFLDVLHADPTRYVTRSVANHLNDIAKTAPGVVVDRLTRWRAEGRQDTAELAWMTRHALRSLVKQGHPGALQLLGYRTDVPVQATLRVTQPAKIGGVLSLEVEVSCATDLPVMVDYVLHFHRPNGKPGRKVFKLKQAEVTAGTPLVLLRRHPLKGDATTFRLHPGPHRAELQVNGCIIAETPFDLEQAE
ncbi:hypothetical protein [Primorskyibacter flagellatus]|uniref:3-methyladenine DNA glycosylase AlkC n=1 Tax=Primorskyibacter flagellatus TaxID=1387277 RepID=A0A1W2BH70_9RHOB|nr:hypothetical protein [Primorskyibacter flagellatus]SMC72365.1 3-methyladenine DNA glycosylase AlkC [Primorskyibacter flagellatus]